MLYRRSTGTLCEISRQNFLTDTEYYKHIYEFIIRNTKNKQISDVLYNDEYIANTNEDIDKYLNITKK